ncbi:MAG TPA: IclR family transcriptional regulator [Microbacteriaceae bacterium]|nr:IclR family transcriptional regulator [Microbacteriaceae bacterium]
MARSSAGRSTLHRAVAVLDAFDPGTRDLSVTEIAHRTGMPLSTCHQLLQELVSVGLIERQPDRRYRVGLRLWELAVRTPGALGIREMALPYLRQAHARIGQSLQLGVLQGRDMLYLERLSAPGAVEHLITVGGRVPFHATSSGLLLAAFAEEPVREALLAEPLTPYRNAPLPDRQELEREFAEMRAAGYKTTVDYITVGTSIAVPIFDQVGHAVATINAIVPSSEPHESRVLEILRPTSAAISRALTRRYRGDP